MTDFHQNNLIHSLSPYLQQHQNNPIHWQEWSKETLEYAKQNNKLLFVSVGYAACHWCHVMAAEAFEDKEIAEFLNQHFVSIKIDKEQRPDIDQYMMAFLIQQQGHGGWPLNVILTPDQKPMLAMTYVPITPKYELPGLLDILKDAIDLYARNMTSFESFIPDIFSDTDATSLTSKELVQTIIYSFNNHTASFHPGPQFPPYNTLLFLLAYYEETKDIKVRNIIETILDTIALGGLHDHLQGGFYRYCVDEYWTTPHFEKMLYDQALLLWVFSIAYKLLKKEVYKEIAQNIIRCLEDTFEKDGLYFSGHDADTHHEEGITYLWTKKELEQCLSPEEYISFASVYMLEENFDGKIHLLKKDLSFLPEIERKLLLLRKKRQQPFVDQKIITSWNALLGIGFIMAQRCGCFKRGYTKAAVLFDNLLKKHYINKTLSHSSFAEKIQKQEFLEDHAALLLFATYFYETNHSEEVKILIKELFEKTNSFFDNNKKQWIESRNDDFREILALLYDHPTPSSVAMVEYALFRLRIIFGIELMSGEYQSAFSHDFHNLFAFYSKNNFHVLHSPKIADVKLFPVNALILPGDTFEDCFKGKCKTYSDEKQFLASFRK